MASGTWQGKCHLEKGSSKINFQHIYAKTRAQQKLGGLSPAEKSGSALVYEVPGSIPLVAEKRGCLWLPRASEWMTLLFVYRTSLRCLSYPDSPGHTRTGRKGIIVLNTLNQGLNLVLLSTSLSIFISLGSYVKALLSTMILYYLAIFTHPKLIGQSI